MESAVSESAGRLVEKDRWVLGAVLERQAELSGDRDFFQFEDHASISYGDFNKTVNRVAHGLTGAGVKAQDRVMIMTPNSTEFVVAWFALRSEEHTSELQSLLRISYAVFFLNKQQTPHRPATHSTTPFLPPVKH